MARKQVRPRRKSAKRIKRDIEKFLKEICLKREGYKCMWCGITKNLQLAHLYPRGAYPWMMFDPENTIILCIKHHLWVWHRDPLLAVEWLESNLPVDRLKALRVKSKLPKEKRPKFDEEEVMRYLRLYERTV